jgi:spermidine synthase
VAARLGHLVAANTLGALAGAVAAPFVLLPLVGPWRAFAVLGLAYGVASLFVPSADRRSRMLRDGVLALGWLAILALASPLALPAVTPEAGETLVYQVTTPSGSVAVIERDGERLIRSDNHYNLGGTAQVLHQERQGHLPLLLHPDARRVAYLGSATGISAGAATLHPVTGVTLVEIAPGVTDAARRYFRTANRQVHEDPRTRIVLDDARSFLRASSERFDVIVGDLFVPWRSGTHALYALEHFQAARARLDSGGLFCQWLPLYQLTPDEFRVIAATFLDAFPESAVFRGDFYGSFPIAALVGWRDRPAPSREVSAAAARMATIPGFEDRWLRDPVGFWSLYVGPLAPLAPELRDVPRNRDDRPRLAYLAARSHVGGDRGVSEPMVGLRWVRFQEELMRAVKHSGDAIYPDLDARSREASRGGALLQAAGSLWMAGRAHDAGQLLARASELLPPELLAQAPADPTAADVWPD